MTLAEIQVSESDGGQYVPLAELEEQIRKRRCCIAPSSSWIMPLCSATSVVTGDYDRKKLDSNLDRNLDGEYMIGHCPRCGGTDHSMIIWGTPDPIAMEYRRERGDDVTYGG